MPFCGEIKLCIRQSAAELRENHHTASDCRTSLLIAECTICVVITRVYSSDARDAA